MDNIFVWQTAKPENQGMSHDKLSAQWEVLKENNTRVFLVIRSNKIVFEGYHEGWNGDRPHYTASAAKSVVGCLALMLAMNDGLIGVDDPACKYIPQWEKDPVKSKITIRQLASHTSGLEDASEAGVSHNRLPGWKGDFWSQERDPFLIARDEVPVVFAPGTDSLYSNPGIAMLAYAVTASLKNSIYTDIRTLLWERIIKSLGINEKEWSIGYGKTFEQDGLKLVGTWGGAEISPKALAKIGILMLNRGNWEGSQLIDPKIVKMSVVHSGEPCYYGLVWRVNSDLAGNKTWPALPWDAFMALGAGGQILLVVPSRKLIVVRNGNKFNVPVLRVEHNRGDNLDSILNEYIHEPLMSAVESELPCPWSTKITKMDWAPVSSVIRHAAGGVKRDGSDNWPMTWADDDHIYTAYGDGYGFAPELPNKLGLGFARIKGMQEDFKCENIRSDAENPGYGGTGEKSSGLLMVEGVLYLWVRNVDKKGSRSRLARSRNYAKTWEWCDWLFEEFGHIGFVNYGKNYSGARDHYVYMLTHDNPSAYKEADRFVMMRVPKERILEKEAYEFFVGINDQSLPVWSPEADKRGPIMTHPNHCRRSSISYNAGIGRYLLWQQYTLEGTDTRFHGGVGIYEAPEPWGPWSTVYFAEKWDIGPGDLGCFPTKWMSEDGKTVYLVFAGDDNFCVRKATLTVGLSR